MGIEQFIDNEVKSNDVVLFMKGTPQAPMCGFSGQVVQILDYLGVFGFDQHRTEPDPRGAKNSDGKPFYTVFVGAYDDRAEADRECSRLKRATRDRPFRNRPDFADFFDDAFVITRSPPNDKAPSPTPP